MRLLRLVVGGVAATAVATTAAGAPTPDQQVLQPAATAHRTISEALYGELERAARLVDIAYCVAGGPEDGGVGGSLTAPFSCASRCGEFPEMRLVTTWHDGGGQGDGGGVGGRLGRLLLGDGGCGYVAVDTRAAGGEVVVAFRGTYSLADTVVDLSTVPQAYEPYGGGGGGTDGSDREACPNCTVHSGFLAAWRRTRDVVLPAVAAAAGLPLNDDDGSAPAAAVAPLPVHLIGHSLGGAVAALAALEMRAGRGWPAVRVTTYGEPRIGNAALATYLEGVFPEAEADGGAYRRVTHQGDPVPLLPPAEWGYRAHAGELYIATAALPPAAGDVRVCRGRADAACLGGEEAEVHAAAHADTADDAAADDTDADDTAADDTAAAARIPLPYPWERVFAHRDYFWRLGLCVPGGDPANWGRSRETEL